METTPTYKTAEELGIEQWEHDGLIALVGPLSRKELKIDMQHSCGTVCCIAGNLALSANKSQAGYWFAFERESGLRALYFARGKHISYLRSNITAFQAARAIVNFLTLGDPKWDVVMRGT